MESEVKERERRKRENFGFARIARGTSPTKADVQRANRSLA